MEFTPKRVKGRTKSEYREWYSDCGQYRVSWSVISGVYQACVKTQRHDGTSWWNFAYRRGPYKTRKAASEACEDNRKLWDAFIQLSHSDGRRDGRLDTLVARAPNLFKSVPVWVLPEADPSLVRMLNCDLHVNRSDLIATSLTSESDEADEIVSPETGPVSLVTEVEGSSIQTTNPVTKAVPSTSDAKPVKAPARARKKPAAKSTARKSPGGVKKSKPGKGKKR